MRLWKPPRKDSSFFIGSSLRLRRESHLRTRVRTRVKVGASGASEFLAVCCLLLEWGLLFVCFLPTAFCILPSGGLRLRAMVSTTAAKNCRLIPCWAAAAQPDLRRPTRAFRYWKAWPPESAGTGYSGGLSNP